MNTSRLRFDVGTRAVRVLALVAFAAACVPGTIALAWLVWTSPATHPNDAWLADDSARLAATAITATLGPGFLAAMFAFARCYVRSIDVDLDSGTASMRTPFRREALEVPLGTLIGALEGPPRGTSGPAGPIPWAAIRLPSQRLPFVLDLTGTFEPAAPEWSRALRRRLSDPGNPPAARRNASRG